MSGRILVIKLDALGDFVQTLGPMAAIRRHLPRGATPMTRNGPCGAGVTAP